MDETQQWYSTQIGVIERVVAAMLCVKINSTDFSSIGSGKKVYRLSSNSRENSLKYQNIVQGITLKPHSITSEVSELTILEGRRLCSLHDKTD